MDKQQLLEKSELKKKKKLYQKIQASLQIKAAYLNTSLLINITWKLKDFFFKTLHSCESLTIDLVVYMLRTYSEDPHQDRWTPMFSHWSQHGHLLTQSTEEMNMATTSLSHSSVPKNIWNAKNVPRNEHDISQTPSGFLLHYQNYIAKTTEPEDWLVTHSKGWWYRIISTPTLRNW